MTQVQETVRIKVVQTPSVHAQYVQVYEGEAIDLRGENFFDQLDLECTVDSVTVKA